MLELRRPADVLIDWAANPTRAAGPAVLFERVALDIKVINALGAGHADPFENDPHAAMDRYHQHACSLQDTARRCQQQGITYMPVVFTAQGGIGRHAEHAIGRIAAVIAANRGSDAPSEKARIFERISGSLARSAARAIARRSPHARTTTCPAAAALWSASSCKADGADVE